MGAKEGPQTLRLLLVDDDEVDRLAVRRALRAEGLAIEVEEAATVAKGVEDLGAAYFDAAIVDYNLPDGDGSRVLDAARDAAEPVPCIVLTGQGDEDLAVDLMKEGARDYIPKGALSPERLTQSLRTVVRVSRAEREARRARRGQEFLIAVSAELAGSLDYEATAQRVAELAVGELADLVVVMVADDHGALRRVAVAHEDGAVRRALHPGESVRATPEGLVGRVITTGEPLFLPELDEGPLGAHTGDASHADHLGPLRPSSLVVLPLLARDRTLGALLLAMGEGRRHTPHDYAVARNLASRAALALDNARLYGDVREEVRAGEELHRFGNAVTSNLELDTVLQGAASAGIGLVGADAGALFYDQADEDGEFERLSAFAGPSGAVFERFGQARGAALLARTFSGEGAVRLSDFSACAEGAEVAALIGGPVGEPALRSYLAIPLVLPDGEVVGGLFFAHRQAGVFGERHERIAEGVARWTAVAVQNARLYAESQRSTRARDEMLAVVSHDLRNPLNVIATSAALILEIPLPEDKKRHQIEVIRRTTERMNRLIQDLLDVTGIEAGKLSVSPQAMDANRLLDEACDSMIALAGEEAVELRREPLPQEVPVQADRERILQVFGNLIGNALRFTAEGGAVTVGARAQAEGVAFFVRDSGPGIGSEELPHLFERFWKGRNSTGTGLGLPIARGIVEVHGGAMSVESREGEGTTFSFTLPAATSASPEPAAER